MSPASIIVVQILPCAKLEQRLLEILPGGFFRSSLDQRRAVPVFFSASFVWDTMGDGGETGGYASWVTVRLLE